MKRITILLILFLGRGLHAGVVDVNSEKLSYDDLLSAQDFTGRKLTDHSDLDGKIIRGSNFSQSEPETIVFPARMKGVTFIDCNLDNVLIPAGNTIIGGSRRRLKIQSDGEDWLLDDNGDALSKVNPGTPLPDPRGDCPCAE